jgi:hypothetical protein
MNNSVKSGQFLMLLWMAFLMWWLMPVARNRKKMRSGFVSAGVGAALILLSQSDLTFFIDLSVEAFKSLFLSFRSDPTLYFVSSIGTPVVILLLQAHRYGREHVLKQWRESVSYSLLAGILIPYSILPLAISLGGTERH